MEVIPDEGTVKDATKAAKGKRVSSGGVKCDNCDIKAKDLLCGWTFPAKLKYGNISWAVVGSETMHCFLDIFGAAMFISVGLKRSAYFRCPKQQRC